MSMQITEKYWAEVRQGAQERGVGFHIEPAEAWKVFVFQDRLCALTGLPINFTDFGYRGTASLDRIDSYKPYCRHNVQWVYGPLNLMKGRYAEPFFVRMCRLVTEQHYKKRALAWGSPFSEDDLTQGKVFVQEALGEQFEEAFLAGGAY